FDVAGARGRSAVLRTGCSPTYRVSVRSAHLLDEATSGRTGDGAQAPADRPWNVCRFGGRMNPHWESPPQDIIDAARKIVLWAEEHALRNWQIMGIGPVRSTVTQPVKEITVRLEKLLTIVETLRSIVGSLNRVAPLMGKLTFDQFGLDLENILSQGLEGCTKAVRDMLALVPEGDQSHGECRIGERPSVGPCIREDVLYVSSKGVLRLQYFDGLTWQWYHVIGPAA